MCWRYIGDSWRSLGDQYGNSVLVSVQVWSSQPASVKSLTIVNASRPIVGFVDVVGGSIVTMVIILHSLGGGEEFVCLYKRMHREMNL